ncbi:hypothetical protein Fmac_007852 [Flemingia macrophylla]|uniref:Secreted protein n=1 Tax=Flemingia macrophylla TaxID=520843 RepID=A0ABD1MVR0_9FABA
MNYRFIAADSLQKGILFGVLLLWAKSSSRGSLEWSITLFYLSPTAASSKPAMTSTGGLQRPRGSSFCDAPRRLQSGRWKTCRSVWSVGDDGKRLGDSDKRPWAALSEGVKSRKKKHKRRDLSYLVVYHLCRLPDINKTFLLN